MAAEQQFQMDQEEFDIFVSKLKVSTDEAKIIKKLGDNYQVNKRHQAVNKARDEFQAWAKENNCEIEPGDMAKDQVPKTRTEFEDFLGKLKIDTEEAGILKKLWEYFHEHRNYYNEIEMKAQKVHIDNMNSDTNEDKKEIEFLRTVIDSDYDMIKELRSCTSNNINTLGELKKNLQEVEANTIKDRERTDDLLQSLDEKKVKIRSLQSEISRLRSENLVHTVTLDNNEANYSRSLMELQDTISKQQAKIDHKNTAIGALQTLFDMQAAKITSLESQIREARQGGQRSRD